MPPKPKATNWNLIGKMTASFLAISIGGPAFTFWLVPTEEELFKKYNPDLQKKSLENREQKQEEFDHFVTKLKEYSKSDKHIWEVAADAERAEKAGRVAEQARLKKEMRERQEELRQTNLR